MNVVTASSFGVGTGAITNVEYIANFIELGDSAMSVIASSLQGQPLQFVVPDYRNYQYSFTLPQTTQTQVSFDFDVSDFVSLRLTASQLQEVDDALDALPTPSDIVTIS